MAKTEPMRPFAAPGPASIGRRALLLGAAAAWAGGALPSVTQCPDRLRGSGSVCVATAGGALSAAQRRAVFEPFQALTGITVIETEGSSAAQVKSQVDSRAPQWDAVSLEFSNVLDLSRQGEYFEKLDYGLIDATGFAPGQVHERALGSLLVGTVITYSTREFDGRIPSGYKDFWDLEKFPGPRNWMSGAIGICPFIEGALLADGVARDALYPLDVPRAFRSLTRIRDSIVKFWESGAQSAQLMADEETCMGIAWNGRIAPLIAAGDPVGIQWNDVMFQTDNWAIPKGAANRGNAMKFIAFTALPQVQARVSMLLDYGFTNLRAADYLPPARLQVLPSNYLDRGFNFDAAWWGDNKRDVVEEFTQWALG